jgi:hypothetical protein
MDQEAHGQLIEDRLDTLQSMPVTDDQTARDALTHVMVTVSRMNQASAQAQAQAIMGVGAPIDGLLDKLRDWLDRLVDALSQIVAKLVDATSFSVSVGTGVSVTVNFSSH